MTRGNYTNTASNQDTKVIMKERGKTEGKKERQRCKRRGVERNNGKENGVEGSRRRR